jgi:hypothetical protein
MKGDFKYFYIINAASSGIFIFLKKIIKNIRTKIMEDKRLPIIRNQFSLVLPGMRLPHLEQ